MKHILLALLAIVVSGASAQIYAPEGVNMPGAWNSWLNPPTHLAFANGNQTAGGRLNKISTGIPRWQTIFNTAASSGDIIGGFYEFKFSSGPISSPWNNSWGNGSFSMNALTDVFFGASANNAITLSNGKWYTMNWIDAGYANTQAIFMETSSEPVILFSATQAPMDGNVESTDPVTINVNTNNAPNLEELIYVRYTTDAYLTSSLALVTFSGQIGTATIPAQAESATVEYYIFSTTVANPPASDIDKITIRSLTNAGANFVYTVNSPLPPVNITFQVDMNQVTVDPSGVYLAGSFNGFSDQVMNDIGGGIYTYTESLPQGSTVQYKFKNGPSGWEGAISAPCGDGSNRTFLVGSGDATVDLVCFNSCAVCTATHGVTFRVNMSAETVGGTVYINGNFPPANWSTPQAMTDEGGGIYSYTATLGAGNNYEYKFINGSSYEGNLSAPCGNGSNRTLTVPTSNTTLPVACFGYCGNCTTNAVTFRVDMSPQVVDPSGVFIAGSFNSFSNTAMNDVGNGVYAVTLNLQQGTSVSYKFKNGTTGWEGNIGAPCGDGSNRVLNVSNTSSQLVAVNCFNSCGACPQFYDMTFAVNMANTLVSPNGVHLMGGFGAYGYANWSPLGIEMTDPDGNGIYTATLSLPEGQSFEYKFINGNDWPGAEGIPVECSSSTHRTFTVMGYDGVVGGSAFCFGHCTACVAAVSNDSPYNASNVVYSSNMVYPNCFTIQGNTSSASDSPQSAAFTGKDVWYKFTAISSGVSVTLNSSVQDDAIAIYSRSGSSFNLLSGASENASSSASDFERLNYSGLTPGQTYYVCAGSASGVGGAFSLCIQHLAQSGCNYSIPSGGYNLCNTFKSTYRGGSSQGVSYTFNFAGVGGGATGTSSITGTNLVTLSNPALGLRYGGVYDVQVNVNYALQDGAAVTENVVVSGNSNSVNCNDVTIMAQPGVAVRSDQRCPASLTRGTYLNAARIGTATLCGAQYYTYEFTQVASCDDGTVVSLAPVLYTNTGSSPYLRLTVLPNLGNPGAWDVRIRPNFSYGEGTFGPAQRIQVIGTSASGEVLYEEVDAEKSDDVVMDELSVYPNPSNGEFVNISLTHLEKGQLQVRVLDAAGRAVTTRMYAVEGTLNTTLTFDGQLSAGVYMIEMAQEGRVQTQRFVVQ